MSRSYCILSCLLNSIKHAHCRVFSSSSDGVAECYKCCCLPRAQFTILGAIQGLRNTVGGGGVSFHGKRRYEGVWFNVISVTDGEWGSNFQEESVT